MYKTVQNKGISTFLVYFAVSRGHIDFLIELQLTSYVGIFKDLVFYFYFLYGIFKDLGFFFKTSYAGIFKDLVLLAFHLLRGQHFSHRC